MLWRLEPPLLPPPTPALVETQSAKTTIYIPASLSDVFKGTWTQDPNTGGPGGQVGRVRCMYWARLLLCDAGAVEAAGHAV